MEDFDEKSLELIRAEFSDALLQILLSSGKARRHCEGYFTFSQPISFDLLMSQKLTAELGDTLPDEVFPAVFEPRNVISTVVNQMMTSSSLSLLTISLPQGWSFLIWNSDDVTWESCLILAAWPTLDSVIFSLLMQEFAKTNGEAFGLGNYISSVPNEITVGQMYPSDFVIDFFVTIFEVADEAQSGDIWSGLEEYVSDKTRDEFDRLVENFLEHLSDLEGRQKLQLSEPEALAKELAKHSKGKPNYTTPAKSRNAHVSRLYAEENYRSEQKQIMNLFATENRMSFHELVPSRLEEEFQRIWKVILVKGYLMKQQALT